MKTAQSVQHPAMNVIKTAIPEVLIVEPKVFGDARGFFTELYQADRHAGSGIASRFVQYNLSRSARGVLRGLHFQNRRPQGKLVTALRGCVLDVAVDVRAGSPTFGRHVTVELSEDNRRQLCRRLRGALSRRDRALGGGHDVPFVHFSTDYVFNGAGERPWREDDRPGPLSVHGASKLAAENEIRAAGGSFLILRTSRVYAAAGTNFLRTIARLARERKELRIVADQIGAPTSAPLLADALAGIVAGGSQNIRRCCAQAQGLVHLAASDNTSWHGFARPIVEGLRARGHPLAIETLIPIRTDEYPTKVKRPRNSRLDLGRWRASSVQPRQLGNRLWHRFSTSSRSATIPLRGAR
jgi:dTDP-4-dehydrorhamnose reductase